MAGRMRFLSGGMALLLALGTGMVARGQEADEPERVRTIKEVVVQSSRPVAKTGGASAVEAEIDSLPVPVAATVEDVLRELPLLHVRTNSRGEAEISARGSESRQVAVLLDGVPITLAWDARADVSVIPASALQEVTYTRGLSSMVYGPNVLGGVIEANIGPQPVGRIDPTAQMSMGADHVGSFATKVAATVPHRTASGTWAVRAGAGFRTTPGDPLAKDVTEPIDTGDDLRLNTDAENIHGFLSVHYRADSRAWFTFSGSTFKEERGIAAELGVPDEDARLWRYPHESRTLAVLSGGTGFRGSPLGGHGQLQASAGYDVGRTDIDAYSSRAYEVIDGFDNGKDHTLTLRLLADQTMGARGKLRGSFTWSDIHHDESIPEGDFEYQQRLLSVGAESTWRLFRSAGWVRSFNVSFGGAFDRAETPKTGGRESQDPLSELGGRLGMSASVGEAPTVLHAGVSRRGRFPALRELYSGALNRFVPNPDLEPEKLLTLEAGATRRLGRGDVQVVLFHTLLEDAVVRTTLDDGSNRFMRVNRNELTSTGVELMLGYRLGMFDLSANGTLQSVDLTDTEADQTNRPENLPETFGELTLRFPIIAGVRGSTAVEYTGDQYVIDASTGTDAKLDAETLVHAYLWRTWPVRLSWGPGAFTHLETRLSVENAGDVALYDAWGLPRPGRRFRLELRLR